MFQSYGGELSDRKADLLLFAGLEEYRPHTIQLEIHPLYMGSGL